MLLYSSSWACSPQHYSPISPALFRGNMSGCQSCLAFLSCVINKPAVGRSTPCPPPGMKNRRENPCDVFTFCGGLGVNRTIIYSPDDDVGLLPSPAGAPGPHLGTCSPLLRVGLDQLCTVPSFSGSWITPRLHSSRLPGLTLCSPFICRVYLMDRPKIQFNDLPPST